MAINAKIREKIQNANSQLNTRARFQTPILTSPSHVAFLPFYTLDEGYEAAPGEDNRAVVSNWRWYSSSRTPLGFLPAKRLRQKPAACTPIAEDRPSLRRAPVVLFALHKNWEGFGEALDANEAIRTTEQLHPDLIALDFKMHRSDGFQAANGILGALPDVPIVMFTLLQDR